MSLYQRGKIWWFKYRVDGATRRVSLGVTAREIAEIKAADLRRDAELQSAGINTHRETRSSKVDGLVDEFERELRRRGRDRDHILTTVRRVRRFVAGVEDLVAVTPTMIERKLVELRDGGELDEDGEPRPPLGPATVNGYRVALSTFFQWLVKSKRWAANPVAAVERCETFGPDVERRSLTPQELGRLLAKSPFRRSICYRLAVTSGLRRKELKQLRWCDLELERCLVTLPAKKAKNRKPVVLPLPANTIAALKAYRAWLLKKKDGEKRVALDAKVFRAIPRMATFELVDLVAAEIAPETAAGKVDFHALRVTFSTALALARTPPALHQKLMRHSDPKLTMNVYTKLGLLEEAGRTAVEAIDVAALELVMSKAEGKGEAAIGLVEAAKVTAIATDCA